MHVLVLFGEALPRRWMDSHELRQGDVLVGRNGEQIVVDSVDIEWEDDFPVCNLPVEGIGEFALVHDWWTIEIFFPPLQARAGLPPFVEPFAERH